MASEAKTLKSVNIDSNKEYESLRQEVLKRLEFQNTLLTINSIFVGTFFGLGLKENIMFLFFIPIVECVFAFLAKHNTYYMTKIDFFIQKRFKNEDGSMLWQEFDVKFTPKVLWYQILLNLGSYAVFIVFGVVPLLVGMASDEPNELRSISICVDWICIGIIGLIFFYFDWNRINNSLDEQIKTIVSKEERN